MWEAQKSTSSSSSTTLVEYSQTEEPPKLSLKDLGDTTRNLFKTNFVFELFHEVEMESQKKKAEVVKDLGKSTLTNSSCHHYINGEIYENARIVTYINQNKESLKIRREDGRFDTSEDTSEEDSFNEWEYYQEQDKIMDEILEKEGRDVMKYHDNLSIKEEVQQLHKE